MSSPLEDDSVSIELVWPDDALVGAMAVNQFIATQPLPFSNGTDTGELLLVFGEATPPIRPPEGQYGTTQSDTTAIVPVIPRAKLLLNRGRVVELRNMLDRILGPREGTETDE